MAFTHGWATVYPKKYAHGFCFAVLCCCYTLTDFPISIRLTSLALRQSNDCPSASKATLMNMDKYFMWIHYERLHNHNKAKHNKTVCIFLGIYCMVDWWLGLGRQLPWLRHRTVHCDRRDRLPMGFPCQLVTQWYRDCQAPMPGVTCWALPGRLELIWNHLEYAAMHLCPCNYLSENEIYRFRCY